MPEEEGPVDGERLRDFLEVASDWLWETDGELRLTWLSPNFFEATGLEPDQVLGLHCYRLNLAAEDSPEVVAHLGDLAARRPFRAHRFVIADAQGRERVLETSGKPVFDAHGRFRGYRGTALEITERVVAERSARASEERLRALLGNMRGILFYHGEAGDGPFGYRHGAEVYGSDAAELAGGLGRDSRAMIARWYEAIHPDDRRRYLELEERRKREGEPYSLEYRIYHPVTGELRWMREVGWVGVEGDVRSYDGFIVDVTEHKRTEQALRASEARYRRLLEAAPVAILLVEEQTIVFANRAAAKLLGAPEPDSVLGRRLDQFSRAGTAVEDVVGGAGRAVQVWQGLDGRRIVAQVGVVPLRDGERDTIQLVLVDMTARMEAQERAYFLAFHDPLTGLANRTSLGDRLAQALALSARRRTRTGLLIIDLDGFKEVNDTLGHAAGDELLRQVGKRFSKVVRSSDTLARLGGDEFAIIQLDVHSAEDAASLARRLLDTLAEPFDVDGHEVHAAASIGVALYPDDADDAESLMRKADLAMYRAKEGGRNDFAFFVPALDRVLQIRRAVGRELRGALDSDAFFLVYQAKVDIASGTVVGAEALLRWRHPTHGVIGPDAFISVAEANGLIRPIGRRVLELACAQLARWVRAGFEVPVAINVSAAQLRDSDFVLAVERELAQHALVPSLLGIEITESLLVDPSLEHVDTLLTRIAALGVEIAIDDFGTGYSSLLNLKRLPVQTIKIDRSFVSGIGSDRESETIVEATIHLARALGKSVVAEGVEHPHQAAFLSSEGCRLAQGYLYARPVEAAAFHDLASRSVLAGIAGLPDQAPR